MSATPSLVVVTGDWRPTPTRDDGVAAILRDAARTIAEAIVEVEADANGRWRTLRRWTRFARSGGMPDATTGATPYDDQSGRIVAISITGEIPAKRRDAATMTIEVGDVRSTKLPMPTAGRPDDWSATIRACSRIATRCAEAASDPRAALDGHPWAAALELEARRAIERHGGEPVAAWRAVFRTPWSSAGVAITTVHGRTTVLPLPAIDRTAMVVHATAFGGWARLAAAAVTGDAACDPVAHMRTVATMPPLPVVDHGDDA